MDSKVKLSECLGYLTVALAQYVMEYGLPYGCGVDQYDGAILIQMINYEHIRMVYRSFAIDYILSLEDPIECLRMELVGMHKELSGEETNGSN